MCSYSYIHQLLPVQIPRALVSIGMCIHIRPALAAQSCLRRCLLKFVFHLPLSSDGSEGGANDPHQGDHIRQMPEAIPADSCPAHHQSTVNTATQVQPALKRHGRS